MAYRPRGKEKREAFEHLVAKYGEPKEGPRSGFSYRRGGRYATRDTKFGVKYQCLWCGRVQLGIGGNRNHRSSCPAADQIPAAQHQVQEAIMTKTSAKISNGKVVVGVEGAGGYALYLSEAEAGKLAQQVMEAVTALPWVELLESTKRGPGLDVWVKAATKAAGLENWASLGASDLPQLCGDKKFRTTHPNFAALFDQALLKAEEL